MIPVDMPRTHMMVGIPACGRMTTVRWGINLALLEYPLSMGVNFIVVRGAEAGVARNQIVEQVKAMKSKLLLMIDDDVVPPAYAVQKLLYSMMAKPNVMASAGIVYTKSSVPSPLVFNNDSEGPYFNWKKGQVFEVPGFISTGCMLIKMEVFDKLEYPWFKTLDYPDKVTEDVYFCQSVMKAGYKILGHGGVICGHYDARTRKVIYGPEDPVLEIA